LQNIIANETLWKECTQRESVLAACGPFNGNSLHKQATAGSSEHHNNMEAMAEEVRQCINQATFGRNPLFSYRGVKEFTFSDEEALQNLLF